MGIFSLAEEYAKSITSMEEYGKILNEHASEVKAAWGNPETESKDLGELLAKAKIEPDYPDRLAQVEPKIAALRLVEKAYEKLGLCHLDESTQPVKRIIDEFCPNVVTQVIRNEAVSFFDGWHRIGVDDDVFMHKSFAGEWETNDAGGLILAMYAQKENISRRDIAYGGDRYREPTLDKKQRLVTMPAALFEQLKEKELDDLAYSYQR